MCAERGARLPRRSGRKRGERGGGIGLVGENGGATTGGIEVYGKHGAKEKGVVGRRKRGESERRDCGLGKMGERGSENGAAEIGVVGIRKRKTAGKRGDPLMRKQW